MNNLLRSKYFNLKFSLFFVLDTNFYLKQVYQNVNFFFFNTLKWRAVHFLGPNVLGSRKNSRSVSSHFNTSKFVQRDKKSHPKFLFIFFESFFALAFGIKLFLLFERPRGANTIKWICNYIALTDQRTGNWRITESL